MLLNMTIFQKVWDLSPEFIGQKKLERTYTWFSQIIIPKSMRLILETLS